MDDKIIIHNLICEEEKGYEMMIDKYTPYITTIVYNMCSHVLTKSDMEEIVADVFFKIWKNRNNIKGDSLKGLIIKTSRNSCLDAFKKNKQEFLPLNDDVIQQVTRNNIHHISEQNEQMEIVMEIVKNFNQPDQEIFTRFYYFGEKLNNISSFMNINISTVKTKLRRCKEKLKTALIEGGYNYE